MTGGRTLVAVIGFRPGANGGWRGAVTTAPPIAPIPVGKRCVVGGALHGIQNR